jgi:hypothetical protein
MIYLTADTINGVQISEPFADDYDVLGEMDFYDALPSVQDGEILHGVVSPQLYEAVAREYGIR